jgi:hypothetical protein
MRRARTNRTTSLTVVGRFYVWMSCRNSSRVEAEVKHFFYEAKPKNGHDSWREQKRFYRRAVRVFEFLNEFEDENEDDDEDERPDGLALKLFKLLSEL